MYRVYVAGAYSADNPIKLFDNMRKGMQLSKDVLLLGYAPFCPWNDYHFILSCKDNESFSISDFYDYSLAWLEKADAMLLVEGYENSKGTKDEIIYATKLKIPIFTDIKALDYYFENKEQEEI